MTPQTPLNFVCSCGFESRGVRRDSCPQCGKQRASITPQTQFTPGPYTSDDDLILDSSDYVLAVVQPNENHEGNVALFRSAPSLYAALQALLKSFPVRDEAAYWEKRVSEEPELMLEPEELALMEAVTAARKALAMGSGGELGSSTPR